MGSKYPVLTPKEVIKRLEKFGFYFVSQKGSHLKYTNGIKTVIIPNHDEIAKGSPITLSAIKLILERSGYDGSRAKGENTHFE